ncbi:alpha/beta hydrolase [Rhodococcus sp. HNM0563]|uniref:alpha/beta fold hydrolase n=1 Tax=Rhodococcus sp. HNM0563 TaxID=2716339 RepID=UPI00146BD128|nr:alpha/beta hydrolase [Rhodococcus sp. HNM0563]
MSYATNPADGTRIAFSSLPARSGDENAPALMLVHGSALSSAVWRGLGYVAALREHYRLLLPDLRGHGRSDTPHDEDAYAMESIVGDLVAVLDAVGVRHVHYLGYSFGARAGLALAVTAPQRLHSLISLGGSASPQRGAMDSLFFPGCVEVLAQKGMDSFLAEWSNHREVPVDPVTAAAFRANDTEALVAYFRRSDREPGIDDATLGEVEVPTMAVAGSEDHLRVDDTRFLSRTIPGARLAILRGVDHAGTVAAAPEVLSVIGPFLAAHAGP